MGWWWSHSMDLMREALYQLWAEKKFFEIMKQISNQNWTNHLPGFTRSLQEIYVHKYDNCWIWYHTILAPKNVAPHIDFESIKKDQFIVESLKLLETMIQYIKKNKPNIVKVEVEGLSKTLEISSEEIFYYIFNHMTYHRGQIALMIKKLGFESIPEQPFHRR